MVGFRCVAFPRETEDGRTAAGLLRFYILRGYKNLTLHSELPAFSTFISLKNQCNKVLRSAVSADIPESELRLRFSEID